LSINGGGYRDFERFASVSKEKQSRLSLKQQLALIVDVANPMRKVSIIREDEVRWLLPKRISKELGERNLLGVSEYLFRYGAKSVEKLEIEQRYLPEKQGRLRVTTFADGHVERTLTIKEALKSESVSLGLKCSKEREYELSEAEYFELVQFSTGGSVRKTRYKALLDMNIGGDLFPVTVELDVFSEPQKMKGVAVMEIEINSLGKLRNQVTIPDFKRLVGELFLDLLGTEITSTSGASNRVVAQRGVSEEFLSVLKRCGYDEK